MANTQSSSQPPSGKDSNGKDNAGPGKVIQLTNLTRDVLMLERPDKSLLILGDREDTDDKVPSSGRNPKLQPNPVVELRPAEYDALGPHVRAVIDDQIQQGRLRKLELAR